MTRRFCRADHPWRTQTVFGKVGRETIGRRRSLGFIGAGPRSPQPGAPCTYVTTKEFLSHFGFDTLRDLPDMEALEDAGLLSKDKLLLGIFRWPFPAKKAWTSPSRATNCNMRHCRPLNDGGHQSID